MDDTTTALANAAAAIGIAPSIITVGVAVIGLFSVVSTVYPPLWPFAAAIHGFALLVGRAQPQVPAGGEKINTSTVTAVDGAVLKTTIVKTTPV